jgi:hypothetical protein
MNYNQFKNISCYEEFEIQATLSGISKIDILKAIGHQIYNYYFFMSEDGIFNWFDLNGNYIEDIGILKKIKEKHIPKTIINCIIPNSVTRIDEWAFYDCKSLTSITIPDSVISIGDYAFYNCQSLTSITIPNSVTSIGKWAFKNCKSLKEITIPNNVINIGHEAFCYCTSLKEITIPNGVTSIGNSTFAYCKSLTSITIPNSVTSIDEVAFCRCNVLKEVIFKGKTLDQVKQMEYYPFGIEDESIIKCEM